MKKNVLFILIAVLLICLMNFSSATEATTGSEPGLLFDFYYDFGDSWNYIPDSWSGTMCSLDYKDNALQMLIDGGDPSFMLSIDMLDESIELSEYPYIKIRVKNPSSTSEKFELYIGRDGETLGEGNNFHYVIGKEHTEFKDYVIDAKAIKGTWWTGELTTLRVDGLNNPSSDGGEEFYIEYIAFFKTDADAQAWTPDRNQTPKPTQEPTPTPNPTQEATQKPATTNVPNTTNAADDTDDSASINPVVIVICVIVILVAAAAAVLLIIRSKKNQQG